MFSILDGGMLRGLPFEDGEQIVSIALYAEPRGDSPPPWQVYEFLRAETRSFEDLAAFQPLFTYATPEDGETKTYVGAYVTPNLFPLLRNQPQFGRTFREGGQKTNTDPAGILGHEAWQRDFGSDPRVLGRLFRSIGHR